MNKQIIQCGHVEALIHENDNKESDFADVTDRFIPLSDITVVFRLCAACRLQLKTEIAKW